MTRYQVRALCSGDFEALRQPCTALVKEMRVLALAEMCFRGSPLRFLRDWGDGHAILAMPVEFQRSRVTPLMHGRFVNANTDEVDAGRGEGDQRIVSKIDKERFEQRKPKYERLGLYAA